MTITRPAAFYRLSPQVREELETITLADSQGRQVKTHRLSARVRRQIAEGRRNPAYQRLFKRHGEIYILAEPGNTAIWMEPCQPEHHAWQTIRSGIEMCVICHRINHNSLPPMTHPKPALFGSDQEPVAIINIT